VGTINLDSSSLGADELVKNNNYEEIKKEDKLSLKDTKANRTESMMKEWNGISNNQK
jgi:hypothetical protein